MIVRTAEADTVIHGLEAQGADIDMELDNERAHLTVSVDGVQRHFQIIGSLSTDPHLGDVALDIVEVGE